MLTDEQIAKVAKDFGIPSDVVIKAVRADENEGHFMDTPEELHDYLEETLHRIEVSDFVNGIFDAPEKLGTVTSELGEKSCTVKIHGSTEGIIFALAYAVYLTGHKMKLDTDFICDVVSETARCIADLEEDTEGKAGEIEEKTDENGNIISSAGRFDKTLWDN